MAADLFILNSNYEGFSHALLDVMKCETPIITTNVGGNPELIDNGEDGLLINYNNEDELLSACLKILTDEKLRRYLTTNAKNKLSKFSWNTIIKETMLLLKENV